MCFNEDLTTVETTINYRVLAGVEDDYFDFSQEVVSAELDGESVIAVRGRSEYYSNDVVQGGFTESVNYSQIVGPFMLRGLRNEFRRFDETGTEVQFSFNTFEPPRETRFDLSAGDSYESEFTFEQQVEQDGIVTSVDNFEFHVVTRFDGIEEITTPLGTRAACRFTETTTQTMMGVPTENEQTFWIGVGNGLVLDSEPGAGEIISGTINGVEI